MWSVKNGRIRLDIKKVNSKFKITSKDGLYLIHPLKNVWDWEDDEKWLRSVIVDGDGFIQSCSWKKFGNFGEFESDTLLLKKALEAGKIVRFSNKEDGSLCIRSVINGKVIFRTRGTLYGGEVSDDGVASFGDRFKSVAESKYRILLDNNWMTDRSMLFEYVSPDNKIVVRYRDRDLIFLGFVQHDNLKIGEWNELEKIASTFNLNLVKLHDLPTNPIKLLEEVKNWKEEGVVVRCEDKKGNLDQNFIKVKSAFYLANHRMKFSMNYPDMVEFIYGANIVSEQQLVLELQKCDYDWEIIESAKEFYHEFVRAKDISEKLRLEATSLTNQFFINKPDANRLDPSVRKEFAKVACLKNGIIRSMMFSLYDNKIERTNMLCRKVIISKGKV